jgi:hypothetical protein
MSKSVFEIDDFSVGAQELYRCEVETDIVRHALSELKEHDPDTYTHCLRVARITAELGRSGLVEFNNSELEATVRAAAFHDMGKVGVSKALLEKEGAPDPDEWAEIKMHPIYGFLDSYRAAGKFPEFNPVSIVPVLLHHTLQPNGYPPTEVSTVNVDMVSLSPDLMTDDVILNSTLLIALADHLDVRHPAQEEGIRNYQRNRRKVHLEELAKEIKYDFVSAGKIHKLGQDKLLDDLLTFSQDTFLKQ